MPERIPERIMDGTAGQAIGPDESNRRDPTIVQHQHSRQDRPGRRENQKPWRKLGLGMKCLKARKKRSPFLLKQIEDLVPGSRPRGFDASLFVKDRGTQVVAPPSPIFVSELAGSNQTAQQQCCASGVKTATPSWVKFLHKYRGGIPQQSG